MLSYLAILDLFNPEEIIRVGGLTLLLIIVFAETGIFFGFFLPGDSLLFTAGLLANTKNFPVTVTQLVIYLIIAAVAGSTAGYMTGRWAHVYLSKRKENFFYKKEYVDTARAFYRRYGGMAFIIGRFLPIVRTFVTITAGMVRINFKRFLVFNILGVTIWVMIMVLSGYMLGNAFPGIINYLGYIVIGLVVITAIPVVVSWRKRKVLLKS